MRATPPPHQDRAIDHLVPELSDLCHKHLLHCWVRYGIDLLIVETLRTVERQDYLYAQGRELRSLPDSVCANIRPWLNEWIAAGLTRAPGKIVTNVHGLDGQHCHGRAYDCVPMVDREAVWDDMDAWEKVMTVAEVLGLTCGGRWEMRDYPHVQL
jgi:hypothetical protein